ncbi:conserved protein of unknown function [Magnetospirillum gryphiswaldense MSR-1 v2]|uniref:DUF3261 domain-containing protein n=1 Tax=Magnetospirillum gryphiswaldense (strain DSM 6361 / JCM 21280 / NBRC 15271 / MSR-1) TaxID=431944 RepID=V6F2F0_MAGGM|nr:DUF3261 domain-containing protein [Magnetospirillum gryphiswaldense]CDK98461.1 conserved protein of unknown function [Magnetospirillum gryphiswaldense MSR-1 v2]
MIDVYAAPIMVRHLLSLILVGLLAACSLQPPAGGPVVLAPQVSLRLPDPASLGETVEAAQLVTASHGGDGFTFEGRLSVNADRLILVTTDGMGRRAMTIRWGNGSLEVDKASWLPASLPPPANMLADIMLMYWPVEVLRTHVDGASVEADGTSRSLRRDGAVMVEISGDADPWNGSVTLHNRVWEYRIHVVSSRLPS